MPNKTIYVKDSDLLLWEAAQQRLGESISSLFAEFLRHRLGAPIDGFIHVLRTDPDRRRDGFAVMFAPIGPTGSGGPMKPHYVQGQPELKQFLTRAGVGADGVADLISKLRKDSSVSERISLPQNLLEQFWGLRITKC